MIKITKFRAGFGSLLLVFASVGTAWSMRVQKAEATVPYTNTRASLDSSGAEANGDSYHGSPSSMSKDGRYIAFASQATNFVSGDTNNKYDIFVKDTVAGTITRVSVSSSGTQGSKDATNAKISYDGRYVVFHTASDTLVANDNNGQYTEDVFIHDRQTSTTELISATSGGSSANGMSGVGSVGLDVSRDGRYVVFSSAATNLVSGDTNGATDIFVKDRKLNTMTRQSLANGGSQANGSSSDPTISCDGAFIAFNSLADNLVVGDTNGAVDTFVVDRVGGNRIFSITNSGNDSSALHIPPAVSCDGSTVAFVSGATNLVSGDTNNKADIFVYDVSAESIERATVSSSGVEGNSDIEGGPSLSADGRYVAYVAYSSNLVSGDTNAKGDVFFRDRQAATTERVSMRTSTQETTMHSYAPAISPDGRYVSYASLDTGLVSGDTNTFQDIFVSETGAPACSI